MAMASCFICTARSEKQQNLPWHDVPLHRVDGVGLTLLGVGAVAPGYLLACPDAHVRSLAAIPQWMMAPFLSLVEEAVADLTCRFGPVLIFEHGDCESAVRTSACVDHAHLHLWALADRVALTLPRYWATYPNLRSFVTETRAAALPSYLLHSDESGGIRIGPDVGVPQFFRRQIASQLGHPDEWDYAACPFGQHMSATRKGLNRAGVRHGG